MKKKSLSSLFDEYSFPEDFFNMELKEVTKIHCEFLGLKFDDFIFKKILDRVDLICDIFNSKDIELLIKELDLSIEYSCDSPYLGFLTIFSQLILEERKIILYLKSLQEIYLFLYKFLCIDIDFEVFCLIAKYHEICHYIDLTLFDSQFNFFDKYIEITVCLFIKRQFHITFHPWMIELSYLYGKYYN